MPVKLTYRERMYLRVIKQIPLFTTPARERPEYYTGPHIGFDPQVGEMVLCQTAKPNQWSIGRLKSYSKDGWGVGVVEDIVTGELCNVYNENFLVLRGFDESTWWDDRQVIIANKILKALAKTEKKSGFPYAIRGVSFVDGVVEVKISTTPIYRRDDRPNFKFRIDPRKSDSIKSIELTLTNLGLVFSDWPRFENIDGEVVFDNPVLTHWKFDND